MAKNWAVVIGINDYNPLNFTPLRYARHDAKTVNAFFEKMRFDQVYLFTDDSPPIALPNGIHIPSDPTYGNLVTFLEDRFKPGVLSAGDNCWFFFAGHGERHADKDYLMPRDANSRGTKVISGLQVNEVREWLTRSGAGTVIMLLDACRSEGSRSGRGIDPTEQNGVITISSCNPTEKAWEIKELEQGVFTYALLEALELPGERSCATVERLGTYLKQRVPELCHRYGKPTQTPRIGVDPIEKQHFILMPQFARQADIDLMKAKGFQLAFRGNLQLAEQMFLRANVAARGLDNEILDSLFRVRQQMQGMQTSSVVSAPSTETSTGRSPNTAETISISEVAEENVSASPSSKLETFDFDVVIVNAQGQEISRRQKKAQYFAEILGDGVCMDMIQIPGGEFLMGSPKVEGYDDEKPQHWVTVPSFFMGKLPVRQIQWRIVAGFPKINIDLDPDPSRFKGANRPVETVSCHEAVEFCQRLSQYTGNSYRLPSEAEWEYACRAGTETPFHFGKTITTDLANYRGTNLEYQSKTYLGHYGSGPKGVYREETTVVGQFPANDFGLSDMHGNVWEWCLDHWHENYQGAPTNGSAWIADGEESRRSLRGGSWSSSPRYCRSAVRDHDHPDERNDRLGFRVVWCAARTLLPFVL
ncbi:MAG: SUMF1/EgtB/PvdO family nonheme iron enzyme [Elainellaceae cyanobacterium]